MKAIRLPVAIVAASLALAGCNYRDATQDSASVRQSVPQESVADAAPATSNMVAGAVTEQQPAAPVDATPAPVQPTTTADAPAPAPSPDTTAMGAQPEAPKPMQQAMGTADGTAAPTELQRFLEGA